VSVEEYKQKALQQAENLRRSPPPCEKCKTPMNFTGEKGGWRDMIELRFSCFGCGVSKTITVKWGWDDMFEIN